MTTSTVPMSFHERRVEQAATQERVNEIFRLAGPVQTIDAIRQIAADAHTQYPQYDGFWDGPEWTLARVSTPLRSKGGDQALTGDVVLFRSDSRVFGGGPEFYSVRLGWMCAAAYGYHVIRSSYTGDPVGR